MYRLYLLFAIIYLVEGVTEVPFILNVYLRNVLHLEPSQIGQILFLGGLWFIILKPLIGLAANFWRGFNRRAVFIFGLLASAGGWAVIAGAQSQMLLTLGVSLKVVAIACLDVLIDGMIVEVSTKRNRSFIQSLVYGCRFGGGMLCSILAGARIDLGAAAFVQIYYIFSVLSLAALVPVLIYRNVEPAGNAGGELATGPAERVSFDEKFSQLVNPAFGWLLVLMFLFAVGVDTSTYYEPILQQRFSGEFLGRITAVYYLGIMAGILTFPLLRLKMGIKIMFILSLVGWSLAEISCLAIAEWNGALIYFCAGFFNAYTSIVLLTVAAAMCKIRGIETFAFAVAVTVKNLMDNSKILTGGYVMEWAGLTWLFVISSLCGFLPFLILHKIDFSDV
ncbi:MAG: MFS transporter [Candidatus Glassbacteria bacterium]